MPNELTPNSFRFWLLTARPGEEIVYHHGNLMADRAYLTQDAEGKPVLRPIEPVDRLATEVWRAYERGDAMLFQWRPEGGKGAYYVARKRRGARSLREAA